MSFSPGTGGYARRLTELYGVALLLIYPLFTGFRGYAAITASKYVFFVLVTALWLFLLLVCAVRGGFFTRRGGRFRRPREPALLALGVFLLAACLSALRSPHGGAVWLGAGRGGGLCALVCYVSAAVGAAKLGRFRAIHAAALAVSTTLCCAVAVLQLMGFNPLSLFPGDYTYYDAHLRYSGEFLGTIGNVNILAAYLCLGVPVFCGLFILRGGKAAWLLLPAALGAFTLLASRVSGGLLAFVFCAAVALPLFMTDRTRARRLLLTAAALCIAAAAALACGTEGAGLSLRPAWRFGPPSLFAACLAALLALAALLTGRLRRFPAKKTARRALIALTLLAALLFMIWVYASPPESGTLYELSRVLHGELRGDFGSSRIRIWRETLALVPERPLLGGGPDTLALRLDIRFSRFVPETGRTLTSAVDNAHNEYLGLLADLGFLGLIPFLAAMALTVFNKARWKGDGAALGCAFLCHAAQSLFGLGLPHTAPLFWLIWGLFLRAGGGDDA